MDGLCNGLTALAHRSTIASYAPYSILPSLSVFSIAPAFVNQCPVLGAAVHVFKLVWRQAGGNIIPMRQQKSDEPGGKR